MKTNMKHIILPFTAAILLMVSACSDYLDIKPLGQTTLDKVEDLECILNNVPIIYLGDQVTNDMAFLCGDMYEPWTGISESLSNKSSLMYAYMTFDESVDRADLTPESSYYDNLYSKINYMNVVISKMPTATGGTEQKKAQLTAEARILRAWYHFLLVNRYAQQYDASTAASLGGIAYVDNTDVAEQKVKLTLEETYSRILEDCSDEVIADLIQEHVSDPCRFGSDFGYAVRARVLLQMKNYSEALKYANKALEIHSEMEDRSSIKTTGSWIYSYEASNNYYLIYSNNSNMGDYGGIVISPSIASLISPDDYIYKYYVEGTGSDPLPAWNEGEEVYPETPVGCMQCNVWDIHFNTLGLRTESMLFGGC